MKITKSGWIVVGVVAALLLSCFFFPKNPPKAPATVAPPNLQVPGKIISAKPKPPAESSEKTGTNWTGEPAIWTPVELPTPGKPAKPPAPTEFQLDFPRQFQWEMARLGKRMTAICLDNRGRIWVGTEVNGLWCWDPQRVKAEYLEAQVKGQLPGNQPGWIQVSRAKTGGPIEHGAALAETAAARQALGDDAIYALACDRDGRIWVGHLNHGVSVFDGRSLVGLTDKQIQPGWTSYDVQRGMTGERVFDIAVNPVDGDVWIASNRGLSRWRRKADLWTREPGGAGLQPQALAFAAAGTLYVGTQCEGIRIATPAKRDDGSLDYRSEWKSVERASLGGLMPNAPFGKGMPDNLVNDILVTRNGTVVAATCGGLAWSHDGGENWTFQRGRDWEAKVRGLVKPPSETDLQEGLGQARQRADWLLAEDYCTSLAEDAGGRIWVGHWLKGIEMLDSQDGRRLASAMAGVGVEPDEPGAIATPANAYAKCLVAAYGHVVAGCYGEGVAANLPPGTIAPAPQSLTPEPAILPPAAPALAKGMTTAELERQIAALPAPPSANQPWALTLADDWMTQGDWVGRYGRMARTLCASGGPAEANSGYFIRGENRNWVDDDIEDSPYGEKRGMFRWCWELTCSERRVLYYPEVATRRPAGWASTGGSPNWKTEGTNCVCTLRLPADGLYRLSFYFMNYDGNEGANRIRDFEMTVYDEKLYLREPPLARARVHDWFHGVYKNFALKGPGIYKIRIRRNTSFNIMVNGVFLDRISGVATQTEAENPGKASGLGNTVYPPPQPTLPWLTQTAWTKLIANDSTRWLTPLPDDLPAADRAWLFWQLPVWTEADRREFDAIMEKARQQPPKTNTAPRSGPPRIISPVRDE